MNVQNLLDMSNDTVLITGGGTGLGKRFAIVMAEAGATVVLSARRVEKLEEVAAQIRKSGGTAHCVPMDVSDRESIDEAFGCIQNISPISVLVNNAGTVSESMLLDLTEAGWDSVMDTNLKGAWMVGRSAALQMIEQGKGGSIVNIASVLGTCVQKGTGVYTASKSALLHLTRQMALEWARHGIRVNAIAPGYYHTDIAAGFLDSAAGHALLKRIPQRRLGEPEEMDAAVLMLASSASNYMTGSVVTVDGGLSLSII